MYKWLARTTIMKDGKSIRIGIDDYELGKLK